MGVTNPAETYFQNGVWAYDANAKAWVQLEVDASGYLKVTGLTLAPGAATAAHQVTQNTVLALIDGLRAALHSIHTDELDVIVESSALPSGAATSANQSTMITALQLIDDLRGALHDVAADELDVYFKGQSVDVEVKQQVPADLTAALHGYVGGAWQKLPFLWGYSRRWLEKIVNDDAVAGTNTLTTTAVPAGSVYVLQCASGKNKTNAPTLAKIYLAGDATYPTMAIDASPAAGVEIIWTGEIVLQAGDTAKVEFAGCILNDDLVAHFWGYEMDVDL